MSTIQRLSFIGGVLVKHTYFLRYIGTITQSMIEEEKAKIQWLQYWSEGLCVSVDHDMQQVGLLIYKC